MILARPSIDLTQFADRHRYRCPDGHANWRPAGDDRYYRCRSCEQRGDPPYHRRLVDAVSDEMIRWSRVEVIGA